MAVTAKQVAYWTAQMEKGAPEITETAARRFKAIRAVAVATADNGMGLRLFSDDGDAAEVFLNPIVAQRLLRQIASAGTVGEWLDESFNVQVVDKQ